jgi:peptidoglycan/xylan/chitin deacetylase (PgdA/CDA1 family)
MLIGRTPASDLVVLYYHSVPREERARFARQMDSMLRHAVPVAADFQPTTKGHYVALTFDDAFESLLENALPELESRNIPCTIFVVSETLGCKANWEDIGETHGQEQIMSEAQAKGLSSVLVRFGAHTMTHPLLTNISAERARSEILDSRSRLQQLLGCDIKLFSFPYGAYNDTLLEYCRQAGYQRAFTTVPAPIRDNELAAGRTPVDPTDWYLEFRLKMSGAYRWVGFASSLKSRLKRTSTAQPIPVQPPPAALR